MKTIDEAIEYTAKNLPDGFEVEIAIESGGYNVRLMNEYGEVKNMGEESIIDDIIIATDLARKLKP